MHTDHTYRLSRSEEDSKPGIKILISLRTRSTKPIEYNSHQGESRENPLTSRYSWNIHLKHKRPSHRMKVSKKTTINQSIHFKFNSHRPIMRSANKLFPLFSFHFPHYVEVTSNFPCTLSPLSRKEFLMKTTTL